MQFLWDGKKWLSSVMLTGTTYIKFYHVIKGARTLSVEKLSPKEIYSNLKKSK